MEGNEREIEGVRERDREREEGEERRGATVAAISSRERLGREQTGWK